MKKLSLLELAVKSYQEIPRDTLYSRIMCGEVFVNGEKNSNPGSKIFSDSKIEIQGKGFVSRGGLKLKAALDEWNLNVKGKVFIDAGSSTGGFTDCLLQNGAHSVYAVDVGYNQLAYTIRIDKRVMVFEKTNIMNFNETSPFPNAAVADLSFRSISAAGRHIINLTNEKWLVALIKPQFEIDLIQYPEFNGIITKKSILQNVLNDVLYKILKDNLFVDKVMLSPIKGRKGNTEFLFLIRDNEAGRADRPWMGNIGRELDNLIEGIIVQTIVKEVPQ